MVTRRGFVAAGAALLAAPAVVFAQQCRVTPRDAQGVLKASFEITLAKA